MCRFGAVIFLFAIYNHNTYYNYTARAAKISTEFAVIHGMHAYFKCNCVILLVQNELAEARNVTRMESLLSLEGTMTTVVPMGQIGEKYDAVQKRCSLPLVLLPGLGQAKVPNGLRLTGPHWLMFLDDQVDLEVAFRGVDVPFDCELIVAQTCRPGVESGKESVTLTEVYRVAAGDETLRTHAFGSWTEDYGFKGSDLPFFARRSSLHGLVLEAVTIHDPPMIAIETTGNTSTIVGGTFGELWIILQKKLNFTISVRPMGSGLWGSQFPNGSWDGMVGMVVRKEVHCAINALTVNPVFARVIKYTTSVLSVRYGVYISELDGRDVSWSNFLSPFSPSLWTTVLCTTLFAAFVTFIVYRLHHRFSQADALSANDAFFYVFGAIYCSQSHDQNPSPLSARIVYVVVYLFSLIVVSSYSAYLTSSFTVIKPRIPFTSLEGLLEDGSYELGVQKGAYVARFFQEAKVGILKELADRQMKVSSAPLSQIEGFNRVCNSKYAHVAPVDTAYFLKNSLDCKLSLFPDIFVFITATYGFFRKDSPYLPLFNFYLLKLIQGGDYQARLKRLMKHNPRPPNAGFEGILVEQVTPILAILNVGIVLAILCLIVERLRMQRLHRLYVSRP